MFAVFQIEAVPDHLHGYISRFLVEAGPQLFVGTLSPRVVDGIWSRLVEASGTGRLVLIASDSDAETGYRISLHGHEIAGAARARSAVDIDGLTLVAERVSTRESLESPEVFDF